MSKKQNSSLKSTTTIKNKSYHFFSVPQEPPLLCGELLQIRDFSPTKIYFTLYEEDFLYYQNEKRTVFLGKIHFDFDMKIQWILKQQKEKNTKILNIFKISGFKFIVNDFFEEFQSSDDIMLQELKDIIRKKLNQCNFHEYYKAIKKIGKGNFASVYLAENKESDKKFAVKAFSKDVVLKETKGKESIFNEINLMRKLNHPNIIHLYEVHETDNTIYMIMDYLDGGQLLEIFKNSRKVSESEIIKIFLYILNGISYMHENNIMHRDIKPENILFNNCSAENREPIIVDLGLGTSEDEQEYLYPRCGTPGYVAPEILNIKSHKSKYSNSCDIFSVGIIFHLFLLGKSPFQGKVYNEILTQNKNCQINFDKSEYKSLRYDCLDLLKKMLEKDPEKRLSAKECLNHCFLNRSSNAQTCEIDETLGMPLYLTLKKHNEEKKLNFDKINVFSINPTRSPINTQHNRSTVFFKGKSKGTIILENGTSKGSLNVSDSCISFVMRSPIFGVNDSVEEIENYESNQKISQKLNTHEFDIKTRKQNLIKRNNSHFNTIMSKHSEANTDEVSQKKTGKNNNKEQFKCL